MARKKTTQKGTDLNENFTSRTKSPLPSRLWQSSWQDSKSIWL
nr:MAG TPA: hypothetical protein [Caudoviricetes sp.]